MKARKLIAGMLTLALGLSLGAPALAADPADRRLAQVAQKVIATLDIPEDYTDFYGEPYESPLGTRWELNWSKEDAGLNVSATDEGKVLSLYLWENEPYASPAGHGGAYGPSFPEMTREQARPYAQAFLAKVLTGGESVKWNEEGGDSLSATSYNFGGVILLNGIPSPMSFSVRVRLKDGAVTSFHRGDESEYAGPIPAADTVTTTEKAAELLKGTIAMRLEYVLAEGEEKKAVLRYLPEYGDEYYVDAATGALVNLSELRRQLSRGEYGGASGSTKFTANDAAEPEEALAASARGLTDAELTGVAKLEDVLDQEALEKAVKVWAELGLSAYSVATASYAVDRDTGEVTARVVFARNAENGVYRRTVTLDAKTGALQGLYSSNPWSEEPGQVALTEAEARAKAEAFLKALWGSQFAKTQVYNSSVPDNARGAYAFTFAQKENGYFFPGNSISVGVDPVDGTIRSLSRSFDDNVTFDSADGVISPEAAIAAWAGTYPVDFGYLEVPVKLDLSEQPILYKNLVEAGYRYYNGLKPGYGYGSRDFWYLGIDAKTGQPVRGERYEEPNMAYDDVTGHWAAAALNELAQYNVGWTGGKANPDDALTQADYLILLLSAEGYRYNGADDLDDLYRTAYRRGLLTAEERDEDHALDRGQMVKILLDSLGYGPVAKLQGIFRVSFTDADAIPAELLGYAALAQGLGIIKGDDFGRFSAHAGASRAEGAVLLWQYMGGR